MLRISRFYAHDDQVGPYCRYDLHRETTEKFNPPEQAPVPRMNIELSRNHREENWTMVPDIVVVPLYHKIRITFVEAQRWLAAVHYFIYPPGVEVDVEWDLCLISNTEYKKRVATLAEKLPDGHLARLFATQMPRFLWKATLCFEKKPLVDLVMDATGVADSMPLRWLAWFDEEVREAWKSSVDQQLAVLKNPSEEDLKKLQRFKRKFVPALREFLSVGSDHPGFVDASAMKTNPSPMG